MAIGRRRRRDMKPVRYESICPEGGPGSILRADVFDGISLFLSDVRAPIAASAHGEWESSNAL